MQNSTTNTSGSGTNALRQSGNNEDTMAPAETDPLGLPPSEENMDLPITEEAKKDCSIVANREAATTTNEYRNEGKNLSFTIPYNKRWDSEKYPLPPYQDNNGIVTFGPLYKAESCLWKRSYSLQFSSLRKSEDLFKELEAAHAKSPFEHAPEKKKIGNFDTIRFGQTETCFTPTLLVFGEKEMYVLRAHCAQNEKTAFSALEKIVTSMNTIN